MHSIFRSVRKLMLPGLAAVALLQAESHAVVIKVYTSKETADLEKMKTAAATLRESWQPSNPASGQINGFDYQIAEGSVIPKEFSMVPGTFAYFWSDVTFRFEKGFRFQSNSMAFGKTMEAKPQGAPPVRKAPTLLANGLRKATLKGSVLSLEYAMGKAAPVTLEIYGSDGKTYGRWNWQAPAGTSSKSFEANRMPKSGALFLRWISGSNRMVKRLTIAP